MLGTRLGPYELLEELGSGGMASVYRAHQATMGRDVAVKVIYQELADEAGREQFQREARLIARLEHPHILPVYDFDGQSNPPYIVMRYLSGGSLKEAWPSVVARTPGLPAWRTGLRWLNQLADALDYAHRQGIIHRDLKPSNIILDAEQNIFLADFGLASLAGEGTALDNGELLGTPLYASPEQALGQTELGAAADLYALGVLTFELLTRRTPFEAETLADLLHKHAYEAPPPITRFNPTLPTAADEIFARALAKAPLDRYPSATAFVEALALAMGVTFSRSTLSLTEQVTEIPVEQNKIITALALDAEAYAGWLEENAHPTSQLDRLWEGLTPLITHHSGQVLEQSADALVAVWGVPTTHEGDEEQAVRAGLAAQAQAQRLLAEADVALSVGIHTGPALLTRSPANTYQASGVALTIAQRLAEQADGQLLISHDTGRAVLGVFDVEQDAALKVRGRKEPLLTYRVKGAKARAFHFVARGVEGIDTSLIGREAELKQLQRAYRAAVEDQELQAVTLLAEAGLGKSRVLSEFTHWMEVQPAQIWLFQGRATPAMTARPYALLRDILSFRFEILDSDPSTVVQQKLRTGLTNLIGETPEVQANPALVPEMADLMGYLAGFEFRDSPYLAGLLADPKQLAARARQLTLRMWTLTATLGPAILQLDDLHHADSASLELLNLLISEAAPLGLVVIALSRPALFEAYPNWGGGLAALRRGAVAHHRLVELTPLDRHDGRALALELLQKVPNPPKELRDLLVDRAEGNPLFMEELLKILLEDRVLQKTSAETWQVEASRLAHVRVPASLVNLLQTRVEALLAPEKAALQRAAVVGKIFYDTALRALDGTDDVVLRDLDQVLSQLVARGFIYRRQDAAFAGSREYVFTQTMLRETLYSSLAPRQVRRYHAGVAAWLSEVSGERRAEYLSLIAEHYEKAGDLGRAITALHHAGERALQLSAFANAQAFFERGLTLFKAVAPADRPTNAEQVRVTLQIKLADALHSRADYAACQTQLIAALEAARELRDPQLTALALVQLGNLALSRGDFVVAETQLLEALPLAETSGDQNLVARVLHELGATGWRRGSPEMARDYFSRSLTLARAIGDQHRTLYALNGLGLAARISGDTDGAEKYRLEVLDLALKVGNRERAMTALNNLGTIADERQNYTQALDYYQRALALSHEVGAQDSTALHLLNLSNTETKMGNLASAAEHARTGLRLARQLGSGPWMLWGIAVFARLAGAQQNYARGLNLLGLAQNHPASSNDFRRNLQDIIKTWPLPAAEIEAGLAQGAALDFERTLDELLA